MKQAFRNIASTVRIPGCEDPAADILRMVHDWLRDETNGRWLMILDNADDAGTFYSAEDRAAPLESFLPVSSNGWILVTSRNQQSALDLVGVDQAKRNVLEVEPMQETDALLLLKSRTTVDAAVADDAKTLVRALEYIPLAITHAAAFLTVKSHSYTLRAYLRIFWESEPKQKTLLKSKTPRDSRRAYSVSNAVIITWQMSFEQIRETDPEAADLLCLMSMFDNQAIPGLIIREKREPLIFWEVAQLLIDFSLIKVQNTSPLDRDVEERLFDMHSLVQLACGALGSIYIAQARFPEAEAQLRRAVGMFVERLGPQHQAILGATSGLAVALQKQKRVSVGEELQRLVISSTKSSLGARHPDTIILLSNLPMLLSNQKRFPEAEQLYRQVMEANEEVHRPEHPFTITTLSQVGLNLWYQNKNEEAEAVLRPALGVQERTLGGEHPSAYTNVCNLALVLQDLHKHSEAEALFVRAIKGTARALGTKHPDLLLTIKALASLLRQEGKHKAAAILQQAHNDPRMLGDAD